MQKNRVIKAIVSFLLLLGIFFVPGIKTQAAEGGTVYASVEKFTIGQGYLIQPVAVKFNSGETYADIAKRLLGSNGYAYEATNSSSMGFYLAVIHNADSGVINVPKCIQNMPNDKLPQNKIDGVNPYYEETKGLGEFSYSKQSGWYYFVNNVPVSVGMSGIKAKDGDVVRYQFTLYGYGADLGDTTPEANGGAKALKLPNRDSITKKLALMNTYPNPAWKEIYDQVITVASNLDTTEEELVDAEKSLPADTEVNTWFKEQEQKKAAEEAKKKAEEAKKKAEEEARKKAQEAQKKAEAAKQALIKKNTPAKTTLKNVKKSGSTKAQLTWKKVKAATGYEVYQSTKKNSGYKKIKSVNKNKTVSYKAGKLKKKKTYYFKIRTYRKVGGVTYYGSYSNVKKIKIK